MDDTELTDVARTLLRVAPGDFVAARTAAVRSHRHDDRALAAAIGRLRKPAVAAWIVDLLAEDGSLDDAIALGPSIRRAQAKADVDAIGQLRAQRRELVDALADEGGRRASAAGVEVTEAVLEAVRATIEAAMSDERAGRAAASGLLVRGLESVGFDAVDLDGALAVEDAVDLGAPVVELAGRTAAVGRRVKRAAGAERPDPERRSATTERAKPKRRPATTKRAADPTERQPEDRSADRAEARRAETDARAASRAADEALDAADQALDDLDDRRGDLERRRDDLRRELRDVESDLEALGHEHARLEAARDDAEQHADEARAGLTDARRRRRALGH